jgi:catechol 2,3-dioxygenase-like lactoylglutathione lyase family enzyme
VTTQTEPRGIGNIPWTKDEIETFERELAKRPHFARLNHVAFCVDDLEIAKTFYANVLGGRVIGQSPHFVLVAIAGTVIGMSNDRGSSPYNRTNRDEFPHVALEVESDQFRPMKAWLEQHGVKTHEPWTRFQEEGLMYFKDPFGNLIEMYCPHFKEAKSIRNTREVTDVMRFEDLDYTWDQSAAASWDHGMRAAKE